MREHFITTLQSLGVLINHDYLGQYFDLVLGHNSTSGYTEVHHILPKSLFPQYKNSDWNKVRLSAKDHMYAHFYLFKALPTIPQFTYAFWGMINQKNSQHKGREYTDEKLTEYAEIYEEGRLAHAALVKERQTLNNTMKGRTGNRSPFYGKSRPAEVVEKMRKNHWCTYRKPWNHNKANKQAWGIACDAYDKWNTMGKCSSFTVERAMGLPKHTLVTIVKHFARGWSPHTDTEFQHWLENTFKE